MMRETGYEAVIGLEVHAQLLTRTKIFCACEARFGDPPNTHTCPVCLGLPGALPVVNREAVIQAVQAGLALNCAIAERSVFARKNYFYPDCPKNYQISMYDRPLCTGGWMEIGSERGRRRIGIERIHLEDDAGKLVHDGMGHSLIDFNRCGVPLVEIVSKADIRSAEEAGEFLHRLRQILTYLGICDGNMEEGSMRCDVNISLRPRGSDRLGTKTEIKNLNSFKAVEAGIRCEQERQQGILDRGEEVEQVTSLWDKSKRSLVTMRAKEEAHDYRYFPEPDLPVLEVGDEMIEEARSRMPEMPGIRLERFRSQYGLSDYDAGVLTADKGVADYFEDVASITKDPKTGCNWVMREVLGELRKRRITIGDFPVSPAGLAELMTLVAGGTVSGTAASDVFSAMVETGESAGEAVARLGLEQISDAGEIEAIVDEVIGSHPGEAERLRNGEEKLLRFLVGQVMKRSSGRADPKKAGEILLERISR